jgi:hypothetical protein
MRGSVKTALISTAFGFLGALLAGGAAVAAGFLACPQANGTSIFFGKYTIAPNEFLQADTFAGGIRGSANVGPKTPSYLTLGTDATLTNERVLTPGAALTGTDGGAGGTYGLDVATGGVTYSKIQNVSATDKVLGRATAGAGVVEEIACTGAGRALIDDADASAQRTTLGLGTLATQSGTFSGTSSGTNTGDQTITLTGDVTGSGTGSFAATIANDAVTYAKMQNVSATSRIHGRKTAGAGDVEECTISEVLDFIGSAAQGDILYRGSSTWSRLAAGTSGDFLKTLGAGANPVWATTPHLYGGQIDVYTSSGTWTKPTWAQSVRIYMMGAGGGGGSGRRGAAGTTRGGGGGGASGSMTVVEIVASDLPATVSYTVGIGGTGGTAITVNGTDGNPGVAGSDTYIGSGFATYQAGATGGAAGGGGTGSAGTAGVTASQYGNWFGRDGGAGSLGGAAGAGGRSFDPATSNCGGGGGGGGGIGGTDVLGSAGAGGDGALSAISPAGGAAGISAGQNGNPGTDVTLLNTVRGGGGGGGGMGSKTTAAGTGGAGGKWGGGGAGGGASLNGFNSGAGGAGASGIIIFISQ